MKVIENKCHGCKICLMVCSFKNYRVLNYRKAALRIEENTIQSVYSPIICTQCGYCVDYCPEGAISFQAKTVVVDPEKCSLCMNCIDSCPNDVIFIHEDLPSIIKCTSCGECILNCPTGAIV